MNFQSAKNSELIPVFRECLKRDTLGMLAEAAVGKAHSAAMLRLMKSPPTEEDQARAVSSAIPDVLGAVNARRLLDILRSARQPEVTAAVTTRPGPGPIPVTPDPEEEEGAAKDPHSDTR